MSKTTTNIIGATLLAGVLGVGAWTLYGPKAEPDAGSGFEAARYCEDKVAGHLKAPSTAKFDSSATGFGPYTVTGTVDSENSFGAMIRSSYQCTVVIAGDSFRVLIDELG